MVKTITKTVILFYIVAFFSSIATYSLDQYSPCGIEISSIAVDPEHPEIVYARTNSNSGIYKSTDNGDNWNLIELNIGSFGASISVDPKNSGIIYIGGHKSINAGRTWYHMRNGLKLSDSIIRNILYPNNTKIIYSLTYANLIYKSINGGESWKALDTEKLGLCKAFAMNINNQNVLYGYFVRTVKDIYGREQNATGDIFKSDDGGVKWTSLLPALGITELVIDPNNPDIVFAGTQKQGIYRTLNGGKQWNTVKQGLPEGAQVSVFAFDPMNPETVYVGTNRGLFSSNNNGDNWNNVGDGLHIDVRFLVINPKNPKIIYAGNNFDGIFRTTDKGITWHPANEGLPEKSCIR